MDILNTESHAFKKIKKLVDEGKFEDSLAQIKNMILRHPNDFLPYESAAIICFRMGDYNGVKIFSHKAVDFNKDSHQCWFLLAAIYNKELQFAKAEICALNAISAKNDYVVAMRELAEIRLKIGKYSAALETIDNAILIAPSYSPLYQMKGEISQALRNYEEAEESFKISLQKDPNNQVCQSALAGLYINQGRDLEAIALLEKIISVSPNAYSAYWNIVRCKHFTPADAEFIEKIQNIYVDQNIPRNHKTLIAFSLGKIYQDLGVIDLSFECYAAGNILQKEKFSYNFIKDQLAFSLLLADQPKWIFLPEIQNSTQFFEMPTPIFIIGMPRSGTSLIEQILSAHSEVDGLGELELMNQITSTLMQGATRNISVEKKIQLFRNKYIKSLENFKVQRPFFTDKMPTNFRYLGWIVNAFPEAKIIHMDRKAEAVCFSSYTKMFPASGLAWTCDQVDVARYFKLYENTMKYFKNQFGDRIYTINYEFFTENQESELPKLLEHCGLDVQQECFEFYNGNRSVHTASQQQVRKKIYTGSSEVWRQYEELLVPMLSVLRQ